MGTGATLIPAGVIQKAVASVGPRDVSGPDGIGLAPAIRHLIPLVANLLNEEARHFPDLSPVELSKALGMANTKLQLAVDRPQMR